MKVKEFREYLVGRGQGEDAAGSAVGYVREFERRLGEQGKRLDAASVEDMKWYVSELMAEGLNTFERVVALQRYLNFIGRREEAVHLYFVLSATIIYGSISDRLARLTDDETKSRVFGRVSVPPIGAPTDQFPQVTRWLMDSLAEELDQATLRRVLAGNHHGVPAESFAKHREWLGEAGRHHGVVKRR